MNAIRFLFSLLMAMAIAQSYGQQERLLPGIREIPVKYINKVDDKIDKYSRRITGKTEKVLAKLSRWEDKIEAILQKVNPEAAARLFGNDQTTFSSLLQKIKEGKAIAQNYKAQYDEYRDKLTTSIKYLEQHKADLKNNIVKPLDEANKKLTELEENVKNTEAVEQFIKERKKKLLDEAIKYIGNSKYLARINKESYYYIETLRNYKEIFSDKKKAEETALTLLNKIPAFSKFIQQNSLLASLFRAPGGDVDMASLTGLQTRASINSMIQDRLAAGGPNAQQAFSQNMQDAQAQLNSLKDKLIKGGGSSSDAEIWPGNTSPSGGRRMGAPNTQRSKTFFQRLEYGSNFQFARNNSLVPSTADIGLSVGYKLNDKSVVGVGVSYKMGMGNITHIHITHQGLGFRGFIDWKLKKQFFVTGGFELNYNAQFKNIAQLQHYSDWQQAGLIGLTKKVNVTTKLFKGTKLQLLYDMLYRQHYPASQPVLFRIGYSFSK